MYSSVKYYEMCKRAQPVPAHEPAGQTDAGASPPCPPPNSFSHLQVVVVRLVRVRVRVPLDRLLLVARVLQLLLEVERLVAVDEPK